VCVCVFKLSLHLNTDLVLTFSDVWREEKDTGSWSDHQLYSQVLGDSLQGEAKKK
jgi:hypothetical protein